MLAAGSPARSSDCGKTAKSKPSSRFVSQVSECGSTSSCASIGLSLVKCSISKFPGAMKASNLGHGDQHNNLLDGACVAVSLSLHESVSKGYHCLSPYLVIVSDKLGCVSNRTHILLGRTDRKCPRRYPRDHSHIDLTCES